LCGHESHHLARDFKLGFLEPVCERCRRKQHITCPVCGKHRKPAGVSRAGLTVCRQCLELGDAPFICPQCGKEGKRHSNTRCETCYWEGRLAAALRYSSTLPEDGWAREGFAAFMHELAERVGPMKSVFNLGRYEDFFREVWDITPDTRFLSASLLTGLYGREGLRRRAVPYGYMLKAGFMRAEPEHVVRQAGERVSQQRVLQQGEARWYAEILFKFHGHLENLMERYRAWGWTDRRERFSPRTVTMDLRSAAKFLGSLGPEISSTTQFDQTHLNSFLASWPGHRDGLRRFVTFLNSSKLIFGKLKIESVKRGVPEGAFLSHADYSRLLKACLNPPDHGRKEALICLFMAFYAQKPHRIVKMRLTDLYRGENGLYRVSFGKTRLELDHRVSILIDYYLGCRKALHALDDDEDNPFLFPGRKYGSHLSPSTVTVYLKKWKVTADQMFATALLTPYLKGLRHPKVLVKALGVNDMTAVKYYALASPRLGAEASAGLGPK
jgi:integrase